jgi:hypothetical protein
VPASVRTKLEPLVSTTVSLSVVASRYAEAMLDGEMPARSMSLVGTDVLEPTFSPVMVVANPFSWFAAMDVPVRSSVPLAALSKVTVSEAPTEPSSRSVEPLWICSANAFVEATLEVMSSVPPLALIVPVLGSSMFPETVP